jgi:hypothetical protein
MSAAPKITPEPEKAMTRMFEFGEDGVPMGRDPRTMTHAELEAMGHHRMSRGEAIRAHCIDCCGGSWDEVRKCTAIKCPSWPFRMGNDPWREKRVLTTEQRQERAVVLATARGKRNRDELCQFDKVGSKDGGVPPRRHQHRPAGQNASLQLSEFHSRHRALGSCALIDPVPLAFRQQSGRPASGAPLAIRARIRVPRVPNHVTCSPTPGRSGLPPLDASRS